MITAGAINRDVYLRMGLYEVEQETETTPRPGEGDRFPNIFGVVQVDEQGEAGAAWAWPVSPRPHPCSI